MPAWSQSVAESPANTIPGASDPTHSASDSAAEDVAAPDPAEVERRVPELIALLGSPRFAERESAGVELLSIGGPALAYLETLPGSSVFEVRERAKIICGKIEEREFETLSKSFLQTSGEAADALGLPGWGTFSGLVGSTRSSKLMFLEIAREDREILEFIEKTERIIEADGDARPAFAALSDAAARRALVQLNEYTKLRSYGLSSQQLGASVGLLFAAAALEGPTPPEVSEVLQRMTSTSFGGYLTKQGYQDCLRSLLGAWIPKVNTSMAPQVMRIALVWDLPSIANIAREHLSDNFDVYTRTQAFQCLARFGSPSDVELLTLYFDELTIVEEFLDDSPPPGIGGNLDSVEPRSITRVNAMAVAAAMLLLDEDPRAIFPNYTNSKINLSPMELAILEPDAPEQVALIQAWVSTHVPTKDPG